MYKTRNPIASIFLITSFLSAPIALATELSNFADPDAVAAATIVKFDDFKKQSLFIGPNVYKDDVPANETSDSQRLHASRNELQGTANYYIQVSHRDAGKVGSYYEAYDSNGTNLNLHTQDRKRFMCDKPSMMDWCVNVEKITLEVTKKYLEDNQDVGIRYKVTGKGGEFIDFIPPVFIKGFLKRLDAPVTKS